MSSSHTDPYGFSSAPTGTIHNPHSLHPDLAPASDFSPFFDDFAPLPSPEPSTPNDASAMAEGSGFSPIDGRTGTNTSTTSQMSLVEEDKRRRNTEASARFRIKKKEREQQLERTAAEMSEKVRGLEEKCRQLERENGWLRGLIVERRENVKGGAKKGKREEGKEGGRRERRSGGGD